MWSSSLFISLGYLQCKHPNAGNLLTGDGNEQTAKIESNGLQLNMERKSLTLLILKVKWLIYLYLSVLILKQLVLKRNLFIWLGYLKSKHPNAGILLTDDGNELNTSRLCREANLKQIVNMPTTKGGTSLNIIFTNMHEFYQRPNSLPPSWWQLPSYAFTKIRFKIISARIVFDLENCLIKLKTNK